MRGEKENWNMGELERGKLDEMGRKKLKSGKEEDLECKE